SDPGGALASEQLASEHLRSLQESLQEAKDRAAQNKGGQGFPLPLASRRGRGDGEGDDFRGDEKVAIPSADQYKVPEEFRKDILEAMKQDAPDAFKEQVKGYYEEIVR